MNIIEIENLSHRFSDGTYGIREVNLIIGEGEFVVIAGENGSGKTTLLRHFNGLLLPSSGKINLYGFPVPENLVKARQMVGMVFQDAESQIIGETVFDDVAFGPENLGMDRIEINRRVIESLKAVKLENFAHQRPHLLSGGEKRRLAIAGVLAMHPKIIVFDEPFSNLDYAGLKQVLQSMIDLHQNGHTIILTTHDLEKVLPYANRLIILHQGKIAKDGKPDEIISEVENFGVRQPCSCHLKITQRQWLN